MTILSRLPTLTLLDDRSVDEDEIQDALKMFPPEKGEEMIFDIPDSSQRVKKAVKKLAGKVRDKINMDRFSSRNV